MTAEAGFGFGFLHYVWSVLYSQSFANYGKEEKQSSLPKMESGKFRVL